MKRMKKLAASLLLAAAVGAAVPAAVSANGANLAVTVNGTVLVSSANHMTDGRVYVDLERFSGMTGINYVYDGKKHTAILNGSTLNVIETNRVPTVYIRNLANAAGAKSLTWNEKTRTAQMNFTAGLVVFGDVVSQNAGCVPQNRFTVGDGIVFRMKAQNPITGLLAEDAKLQVHLGTGEVLDMQLGQHPPDAPDGERFWSANYKVTDATPKGTLHYYVTAETPIMKGEYKPFQVAPSLITIVAPESAASGGTAN
ncbi:hypothetical protein I8J29_27660 [Paenibacillus sp. MWE-103]|uniref:Copper amine oxidase-like protein n=1 Tax=Paenibacillus artemisiicola TaxID=1172618 RepID=A0ABS3WI56_9BACL|nr:hypothetical protein [Paenibacillus artemisiicola]MBO7747975.1 hypothetical protein [Paenibacillus artemisiicola]